MSDASQDRFTSRWGLILSVLGIAVGTGNIWRFPRIAAANAGEDGAGAFLVAWLAFLLLWSLPLIIAEYALGQIFATQSTAPPCASVRSHDLQP